MENLNDIKAPTIVLVRPQLGENIGMCARAMLNCGVTDLRIVSPRDGWPSDSAVSASAGALDVIDNAQIFETIEDAIADLDYVIATTARLRGMTKPIFNTIESSNKIKQETVNGNKCGIMFGPERTGLENDDIYFANAVLNIPLNPNYSSLNLAQAVLLVCFSWLNSDNHFEVNHEMPELANKDDINHFVNRLESELDNSGFFKSAEQRPTTLMNLKNFFFRISPTKQEVQTLHGVVKALVAKK